MMGCSFFKYFPEILYSMGVAALGFGGGNIIVSAPFLQEIPDWEIMLAILISFSVLGIALVVVSLYAYACRRQLSRASGGK
jgi:hypothetical protein